MSLLRLSSLVRRSAGMTLERTSRLVVARQMSFSSGEYDKKEYDEEGNEYTSGPTLMSMRTGGHGWQVPYFTTVIVCAAMFIFTKMYRPEDRLTTYAIKESVRARKWELAERARTKKEGAAASSTEEAEA